MDENKKECTMDSILNNFFRMPIANPIGNAPQKLKSLKIKSCIINKMLVIYLHVFSVLSNFIKFCSINNKVNSHSI